MEAQQVLINDASACRSIFRHASSELRALQYTARVKDMIIRGNIEKSLDRCVGFFMTLVHECELYGLKLNLQMFGSTAVSSTHNLFEYNDCYFFQSDLSEIEIYKSPIYVTD